MISKYIIYIWFLWSLSTTSFAKISQQYVEQAIKDTALQVGVPYELLRAICKAESNLKPTAFVYNDGGKENHSYGMCQVLRETAEKFLGKMPGCKRDFRHHSGLERTYKNCKLFGPKTNAKIAAMYLKNQIIRYGGDLLKATAAYNSGSLKICGESGIVKNKCGKLLYSCKPGDLLNRHYINRVDSFMVNFSLAEGTICSRLTPK